MTHTSQNKAATVEHPHFAAVDDIRGKIVLITGATGGIGAAAAAGFALQGAKVGVHYRSNGLKAGELVRSICDRGGDAEMFQADLTATASVHGMFDLFVHRFGRIDVLINTVGGMVARRKTVEIDDEFLSQVLDLNVRSVVLTCQRALLQFRAQGRGNIINVSSVAAPGSGSGGMSLYSASKAFVTSFTRSLALETAKENIRANVLAPGPIMTPVHERLSTPAHMEALTKSVPVGRVGLPEECVGALLYLASDSLSSFVTGATIDVSGGR